MAPNSKVQNNFVHLKLRRWLKILIWKILTFTWTSSSLSGLLICIIHQQRRCRSGGSRGRVSGQARWGQGPTKQLTWKWEALIKQSGSPYTHTRGPPSNVDLMFTRRRLIPRSCWFRLKSNLISKPMSRDPSRNLIACLLLAGWRSFEMSTNRWFKWYPINHYTIRVHRMKSTQAIDFLDLMCFWLAGCGHVTCWVEDVHRSG